MSAPASASGRRGRGAAGPPLSLLLLLLLLLLVPALLTHGFVPAAPRSSSSSSAAAVVGKPAARTLTIDGRRPRPAPILLLRLHAMPEKGDDEATATSSSSNGPTALAALTRRVRALLGQCVTVSLMLLAQFRPVSSPAGSAALLGAPQGTYER